MKKIILFFAFFPLFSCDPGYAYLISNNSKNEIFVYTEPPIKNYNTNTESDSISIKPSEVFRLYSSLGIGGSEGSFPYNKIIIRTQNDTIILKNKTEINSKFNMSRKLKMFSTIYTINVN